MSFSYLKPVVLAGFILLTACQQNPVRFEDSPYALFPAGTVLTQHKDLTLPANSFSVVVQNGIIVRPDNLDWYQTNCTLRSENRTATSRTLKPGDYQIISSERHNEETMLPVRMAGLGLIRVEGDSSKIIILSLKLKSELNPFIVRMTCRDWGEYFDDKYLTLSQVRAALQPLFSIKLPGEQ